LERKGEFASALIYFQNAAISQPDDVGSWMNIGRTFGALNDSKKAEKSFLKAKSLLPQPKLGEKFFARVSPQSLNVFINLGNLYKNLSKFSEAENFFRQAIQMRPDFISAYLNLGGLLLDRGSVQEAEKVFSTGLKKEPKNSDLFYNLGIILLRKKDRIGALEKFQAALASNPNHFYSLVNAGIILL
jgi:tetratricopeptide (TPR) repeat protein